MTEVKYKYCTACKEWVRDHHQCGDVVPLQVMSGMMLITQEKVYGLDFEFNRVATDTARHIAVLEWAIGMMQRELEKFRPTPMTVLEALIDKTAEIAGKCEFPANKGSHE